MDCLIVLVWPEDICPQIQTCNSRKRSSQILLERIVSKKINSVFHGSVANAIKGNTGWTQGADSRTQWGGGSQERERRIVCGEESTSEEGSEGSPTSEAVVGPTPACLNYSVLYSVLGCVNPQRTSLLPPAFILRES